MSGLWSGCMKSRYLRDRRRHSFAAAALVAAAYATPWGDIKTSFGITLAMLISALSGVLLGVTLSAMLLGHWYLNTPTMELLKRFKRLVIFMARDRRPHIRQRNGTGNASDVGTTAGSSVFALRDVSLAVGSAGHVYAGFDDLVHAESLYYPDGHGHSLCRCYSRILWRTDILATVGRLPLSLMMELAFPSETEALKAVPPRRTGLGIRCP